MEILELDILINGLKEPLILAVSKITQKAYLTEGNHRLIILDKLGVHWVPLKITYWFMNDDNRQDFYDVPTFLSEFPKNVLPEHCGFEVKKNWVCQRTDYHL